SSAGQKASWWSWCRSASFPAHRQATRPIPWRTGVVDQCTPVERNSEFCMALPHPSSARSTFGSLLVIAIVIGVGAAAFAYTAGWLSPQRLTPDRLVDAFSPGGEPLGHRRNHAKGICFTGYLEANGAGSALSTAQVFSRGQYPALGRFNLATADP